MWEMIVIMPTRGRAVINRGDRRRVWEGLPERVRAPSLKFSWLCECVPE